ncbi:MAG: hypothetical protein ACRCTX_20315 [Afipia sp.]
MNIQDIASLRAAAAEIAGEADAEIQQLRAGYARLLDAGDVEMGDGDLARQIASEMLAQ